MELDRAHHRPTSSAASISSELFICFTSRLSSSSSMKMAKSILSPGRAHDTPISLSTSLSRRLRTNGSIKGGQASPMFPTGGKKRGCSFENPEPSSPKVTCIGQVRVKTKKKVKQTRSLSRRRSNTSGEVSFRKVEQLPNDELKNITSEELSSDCTRAEVQQQQKYAVPSENSSSHFQRQECLPHRNQKWVHLPVTICEALRTFGAEFSCLFPCRSSCFSTNDRREREEKAGNIGHGIGGHREEGNDSNDNGQSSSCGAVFARWFAALQDCEGGKEREIELVVGGGDEDVRKEARERISMRSSRRHVFEDIEFKEEMIDVKADEGEEKARVSICFPPKNALLLMRCRSDPIKMAALANRFWESPAPKDEDEDEDEEEEEDENGESNKELDEVLLVQDPEIVNEEEAGTEVEEKDEVLEQLVSAESNEDAGNQEKEAILTNEVQEFVVEEETEQQKPNSISSEELEESEAMQALVVSEEAESNIDAFEGHLDQEMAANKEDDLMIQGQVVQEEKEEQNYPSSNSFLSEGISDRVEDDSLSGTEKEETELLPVEASWEGGENEAKADNSTSEEEAEIPTQLEENNNNEAKAATTLLLSQLNDAKTTYEDEKFEQIEASANIQESQEPQQEEDDENKGMIVETKDKEDKENSPSSSNVLPDCLLLMMCEPKLSMEVSKETWVCSTDFIRWLPERRRRRPDAVNKKLVNEASDDTNKKIKKVSCCTCKDSNPPLVGPQLPAQEILAQQPQEAMLPPRSSCSLPAAAAVSMAAMIEQKLVNAVAYEPFVLTRCKSEPMRTAAAKLMPEACFWKNGKLQPHRSATYAAGVGF